MTSGTFDLCVPAPPPEEQQVPDGEQASSRPAGEERHEGDAGHGRKRRLLVLHPALLQTALHRRQRESPGAHVHVGVGHWYHACLGARHGIKRMPRMKAGDSNASFCDPNPQPRRSR